MKNPRVLVLSGLDPSGKSGFLKDIAVITALGGEALGSITCFTRQSDEKIDSLEFRKTEDVIEDIMKLEEPSSVKMGVCLPELVPVVRKRFPSSKIVWNTVLSSTSGGRFMEPHSVLEVLSIPDYVTMNTDEAQVLGEHGNSIVTGGHEKGDIIKIRYRDKDYITRRIAGDFRGTGCAFSSALAFFLAQSGDIGEAIAKTIEILSQILKESENAVQPNKWISVHGLKQI